MLTAQISRNDNEKGQNVDAYQIRCIEKNSSHLLPKSFTMETFKNLKIKSISCGIRPMEFGLISSEGEMHTLLELHKKSNLVEYGLRLVELNLYYQLSISNLRYSNFCLKWRMVSSSYVMTSSGIRDQQGRKTWREIKRIKGAWVWGKMRERKKYFEKSLKFDTEKVGLVKFIFQKWYILHLE